MIPEVGLAARFAQAKPELQLSPKVLTSQQYAFLFRSVRESLPLRQIVGDPSFAALFPDQQLPSWMGPQIAHSLAAGEDVSGFLLRLKRPLIGRIVAGYARHRPHMTFAELEQDARVKFLEVVQGLSTEEAILPEDIEGFLTTSLHNLLLNKTKHDQVERRYVVLSIEGFSDELEQRFGTEEEGKLSGLDVLVMGHKDVNEGTYVDPEESAETAEFWDEVDRVVGTKDRAALVDAHVLELSQHVVAMRLGRSYRAARMHLAKLRERLRKDERVREWAGSEERRRWHRGRRRREQGAADV